MKSFFFVTLFFYFWAGKIKSCLSFKREPQVDVFYLGLKIKSCVALATLNWSWGFIKRVKMVETVHDLRSASNDYNACNEMIVNAKSGSSSFFPWGNLSLCDRK